MQYKHGSQHAKVLCIKLVQNNNSDTVPLVLVNSYKLHLGIPTFKIYLQV